MPPLDNKKHEIFCLNIIEGETKQEAAKKAGYAANSAHVTASKLLKNTKVIQRIEELSGKLEADTIMTVIARKTRLSELALTKNDRTAVMAIAELNKMEGVYQDNSINIGDVVIKVKYEDSSIPDIAEIVKPDIKLIAEKTTEAEIMGDDGVDIVNKESVN